MGQQNRLVAVSVGAVLLMGATGWIVGSAWRKGPETAVEAVAAVPAARDAATPAAVENGKLAVGNRLTNMQKDGDVQIFTVTAPDGTTRAIRVQPGETVRLADMEFSGAMLRGVDAAGKGGMVGTMVLTNDGNGMMSMTGSGNLVPSDDARPAAAEAEMKAALEARIQAEKAGGHPAVLEERTGRTV